MRRPDLVPDCGRCAAICCVATSFDASDDFACGKAAGVACQYLTRGDRCAIHAELVWRGYGGCAAYDCYGAGPRVTAAFAGARGADRLRDEVFLILRVVHELLWLVTEAAKLCPPSHAELGARLAAEIEALDAIARAPASSLRMVDVRLRDTAARALVRRVGDALGGRRQVALSVLP